MIMEIRWYGGSFFYFSACTGTKLEIEWLKPKCYGDALLDRYHLRMDGSNYVDIGNDAKSYVFTTVEAGSSYRFELQVGFLMFWFIPFWIIFFVLVCLNFQAAIKFLMHVNCFNHAHEYWRQFLQFVLRYVYYWQVSLFYFWGIDWLYSKKVVYLSIGLVIGVNHIPRSRRVTQ